MPELSAVEEPPFSSKQKASTGTAAVGLAVRVGVAVAVRVGVTVAVRVGVTVGVAVGVTVGVLVGLMLGVAVVVDVGVGVRVAVVVGVRVAASGVDVGVTVGVLVAVAVALEVAVLVGQKEDAARKVEREMSKRLSAVAMQHRIGEVFDAIVTGVTDHGTFVRVLQPHIEGLLVEGQKGLDVADKIRARLVRTDVQKGYIDFARA